MPPHSRKRHNGFFGRYGLHQNLPRLSKIFQCGSEVGAAVPQSYRLPMQAKKGHATLQVKGGEHPLV